MKVKLWGGVDPEPWANTRWGSLWVSSLEMLMLGESRESVAVPGGSRRLRLVFFYCLVDELSCGFVEVLGLSFPAMW